VSRRRLWSIEANAQTSGPSKVEKSTGNVLADLRLPHPEQQRLSVPFWRRMFNLQIEAAPA